LNASLKFFTGIALVLSLPHPVRCDVRDALYPSLDVIPSEWLAVIRDYVADEEAVLAALATVAGHHPEILAISVSAFELKTNQRDRGRDAPEEAGGLFVVRQLQ
jgi:hypothetical protein